jgi:transposase
MQEDIRKLTRIQPLNYDLFVGMDVDKKSISVTILDHYEEIKRMKVSYDGQKLLSYIRRSHSGKRVVFGYETGPTGWGLFDQLTSLGYACLVAAPNNIPDKPNQKVKTNRKDSLKIAKSIRGGQLEGVRVPDNTYRNLRHLVARRRSCRKGLTQTKNRIKSLFLVKGIAFKSTTSGDWTQRSVEELRRAPAYDSLRPVLDNLLEDLDYHQQKMKEAFNQMRAFCRQHPDIQESIDYARSIPGIGELTAIELVARIGDWRNLQNSDELAAFFGLIPSENSTGDDQNRNEITKQGAGTARSLLVEASWVAIRKDWELAAFYQRIYQRNTKRYAGAKAIVAVARKLAVRLYHVLKYRHNYEIKKEPESLIYLPSKEETLPGE